MGYALLVLINLIYAATPTMMKIALTELSPYEMVWLRHSAALFAILPLALFLPRVRLTVHELTTIAVATVLAFSLTSILQAEALLRSSASVGALMVAMEPVATITLAALFLHERISRRMILGLLLGIVGICILSGSSSRQMEGGLLYMVGVISEASLGVFLRPLLRRHHPVHLTFYCLLIASLALLPFQTTLLVDAANLSTTTWSAVLYLGLGCSGLGTLLWLISLRQIEVSKTACMWFVQPVGGSILAVLILGEELVPSTVVGGGIILLALGLVIWGKHREGVSGDGKITLKLGPPRIQIPQSPGHGV